MMLLTRVNANRFMIAGYSQAGTHKVRLHVKGKGYALANGSAADFKYALQFYKCF